MPLPKLQAESMALNVTAKTTGIYTLTLKDIVAIPRLYDIWLIDKYRKDSLDMRQNLTYTFNMYKNDTASFGANRFSLVLRQNTAYAYRLLSFSAAKVNTPEFNKRVQVTWTTENEQNYTNFTVERSTDAGKTWQIAGSTAATGLGKYGVQDNDPAPENLYRLKSTDVNGTITYSNIIPIGYSKPSNNLVKGNIGIYPNPATSTINVTIADPEAQSASYQILITNSSGSLVGTASAPGANWQTNVSHLTPGTYIVKVFSNKNRAEIGNAKFVKQ
jgi:trimeric autotransporter adhesin